VRYTARKDHERRRHLLDKLDLLFIRGCNRDEVNAERFVGETARLRDLLLENITGVLPPARQPNPPALPTAATSVGSLTHVIAPHMNGYRTPRNSRPRAKNRSVKRLSVSMSVYLFVP
jgi:hypothetical protein